MTGTESTQWMPVVILGLGAIAFGLAPLLAARLWALYFAPAKPGPIKNATYECGLESKGDAWSPFRSEYYLYAILFLIFDVEAVFLLPFAVAFSGLSAGACAAMFLFLLLLAEGLVWAWHKGILGRGAAPTPAAAAQVTPAIREVSHGS